MLKPIHSSIHSEPKISGIFILLDILLVMIEQLQIEITHCLFLRNSSIRSIK